MKRLDRFAANATVDKAIRATMALLEVADSIPRGRICKAKKPLIC